MGIKPYTIVIVMKNVILMDAKNRKMNEMDRIDGPEINSCLMG